MSERVVAAFDLDGTLTRRDTLLPFLLKACGHAATYRAVLGVSLLLVRALAGGERRDAAKEALLVRLLAGRPVESLAEVAEAFADEVMASGLLRPDMLERVAEHRRAGHELVIVSASPELYVAPLGRRLGFDAVLGTRLETDAEGRLTGRLLGPNCRGAEKTVRLREWLGGDESTELFAYGDSRGDREMLAMAGTGIRVHRRRPWRAGREALG
jgi:phosphatidylglycerophosphatase C